MAGGCIHKVWIGWIRICRAINDFIEKLFEHHTRFITNHHKLVIGLCMLFVCVMAVGAVRFKALQRNEELFIPQGSQGFTDLDRGQKNFDLKFRFEEFIIIPNNNEVNILDNNLAFKKALELHNKILLTKNFKAACASWKESECLFVSSLEVFDYNMTTVQASDSATIRQKMSEWLNDTTKLFRNGRPANLNFPNILGKYNKDGNDPNFANFANAVRMTYYMKYADTDEDIYDTINGWEKDFIDLCEDNVESFANEKVDLFYFAARTRDDAILSSTVGDLPLFSVAFILMVAFCLFVFLRIKNPVAGHLTVGITGIFVIMLGVGCGFGLAMWIGTDFVAFTGILMFLILGIGMDNMFIIVDAMESVDSDIQGPERLVIGMKHIGGSITMTTTTDLVAFAVSTVSDFPAVHLFCVYAALSIFFAYAMLITLFVALLTADIHRIENGKRDVFPCCSAEGYPVDNPWDKEDERYSKKYLMKWAELLMKTPMKVIVFFAACGLLAAGIYGTTQITQKFEWKKLGRDGSYFRKFADARDKNFPAGYGVSIIIPKGTDYNNKAIQKRVMGLDQIAAENSHFENQTINWLKAYESYRNILSINTSFENNITDFLDAQPMFKADVLYDRNKRVFNATRVIFFYEDNNDAINQAEAMKTIRTDLQEKSQIPGVYPISIMFIYAEQFAAVLDDTVRNLAICAGTILVITLPYLTHPGITGLVFLSFTSLLFELLGLMAAWDVSLDAIAMIIIIMAIGFSVDYTCHIAHAYMISQKDTPEERVVDALGTMGTSVLNGGVSTILGMLITAFSGAEGFRIFFKMVFGIVLLGLIHGLIFLPVLLSIFIRRDLREDMRIFIEKHDDIERRKSKRRFSHMSEQEKQKQSLSYRKQSIHASPTRSEHSTPNGHPSHSDKSENVELRNVRKVDSTYGSHPGSPSSETVGSPNTAYEKEELPVFYTVKNE